MPEFVDAGPSQVGTALSSATLDALVVAQTYLVTGTAPAPSATLAQAFPSVGVVFNTGATDLHHHRRGHAFAARQ